MAAEIRDLPGGLDLTLYVGRASAVALTFPVGFVTGRTFSAVVTYPTGAQTYVASTVGDVVSFTVLAAHLTTEFRSCTWQLLETTGGGSVPIIAGQVSVTHDVGGSPSTATVQLANATATVTVAYVGMPGPAGGPGIPTYATTAARNSANPSPAAGLLTYLTTPKLGTFYNGSTWDGLFPSYTNAAARDVAIPTPDKGMLVRLSGVETLTYYNGTIWVDLAPPGIRAAPSTSGTVSSSGGTEIVLSTSTSFTAIAGRRHKITAIMSGSGSVAGDVMRFSIRQGASIAGTVVSLQPWTVPVANYLVPFTITGWFMATGGATQYSLCVARLSGTGVFTSQSAASYENSITVEDVGYV